MRNGSAPFVPLCPGRASAFMAPGQYSITNRWHQHTSIITPPHPSINRFLQKARRNMGDLPGQTHHMGQGTFENHRSVPPSFSQENDVAQRFLVASRHPSPIERRILHDLGDRRQSAEVEGSLVARADEKEHRVNLRRFI